MKKVLIFVLLAATLLTALTVFPLATSEDSELLSPGEGAAALDGKKIIFVGNNYTHSGGVVEYTSTSVVNSAYSKRTGDKGYFYRLCKANGAEVTVVDWAFSSHNISSLFSGETCKGSGHTAGTNHVNDMTNKVFDYVVLQEGNESYTDPEDYYTTVKAAIDLFRDANPNVKIIYAIPNAVYTNWSSAWKESIDLIAAEGVTVVDWGGLVTDVYTGRVDVPGATLDYNKQSFIISTSATSVYPNLLSGYVYVTMVYCAITGETAVGQSYDFVKSYTGTYSLATFTKEKYTYDNTATEDVDESETNMTEIFNSDADMRGIQQLCDEYLKKASWRNYTVTFLDSDGTVISSESYRDGDTVTVPEPSAKEADENFEYAFVGWDKDVSLTCSGDATYVAVYEKRALKEWGTFAPGSNLAALDGKKILFTGCSYTYYGGLIEQSGSGVYSQATRTSAENGYFKRLCNEYGIDVTVTDWVFGGHDLTDIFDGSCAAGSHDGHDHLADLTDRNYDYVVLQEILVPGYTTAEQYYDNVRGIMDIFLEGNPNTKFFYSLHNQVYAQSTYGNEWKKHIQMLADDGVTMINWGAAVYDVWTGRTEPEGAELEYNKQSFIVSNSAADGYHPTLLSGYVNLVMTWSAITGESPVGQPIEFVRNCTGKYLGIDAFITNHFKYDNPVTEIDETQTNMAEALRSDTEMLAFQRLASEYLNKASWLEYITYKVSFVDTDGTVILESTYHHGDPVEVPADPIKAPDGMYSYVFDGWDKDVTECLGDAVYTAVYRTEYAVYTVVFLDGGGEVILSSEYHWGDAVTPPEVADSSDGTYRYVFSGWDKEITECNGNATYTATYVSVDEGIVIVWRDSDGSLIKADSYKAGEAVTVPDAPVKQADNVYTYAFLGWDREIGTTAVADATYTATYSAVYVEYTVIFKDDNGDIISDSTYHWGDEISVPNAPTRASDNVYSYAFSGWDKEVTACSGDATYTATYEAAYVIYSITFFDDEGEVILTRTYHWGDAVFIPEDPTKPSEGNLIYAFAGWDNEVAAACSGSAAYYATFTLANGTLLTGENLVNLPAPLPTGSAVAGTSLGGEYSYVVVPESDCVEYRYVDAAGATGSFLWARGEGELVNASLFAQLPTAADGELYKYVWRQDGNLFVPGVAPAFSLFGNLTLSADIYLNLYIETSVEWDKIGMTVCGAAPEPSVLTVDGVEYYKISVKIAQARIDEGIDVGFAFSVNGETMAASRSVSVLEYVQVAKGNAAAGSKDHALLDAILNYAEAVYAYTHDDTADYAVEGTYVAPTYDGVSEPLDGIFDYSINLGESLRWVFTATDYDSKFIFTYTYNGETVTDRLCSPGINRQIVISVKACDMLESIYVTNEAGETAEINLATYYNDLKDRSLGEDLTDEQRDEALAVVDSIYHYAAAAKAAAEGEA